MDDILNDVNAWRMALPGMFKKYNISPVVEVEKYAPNLAKLVRKMK